MQVECITKLDLVLNHVTRSSYWKRGTANGCPESTTAKLYQQQQMLQSLPMSVSLADTATYPQNQGSRPFQNRFNSYGPAITQFMNAGELVLDMAPTTKKPRHDSAQLCAAAYRMSTQNHSFLLRHFNPSGFSDRPLRAWTKSELIHHNPRKVCHLRKSSDSRNWFMPMRHWVKVRTGEFASRGSGYHVRQRQSLFKLK